MWGLPTFLSWPFSLPSLPSISLPANIQRRFLSYVLKRALGRFVIAGGLDVERIQAQISEGWVEIEGLEVDTEEINALLPPSIPLHMTSGSLAKVTARVPFPNLWSDPLSLTLDTLELNFSLMPSSSKSKTPVRSPARPTVSLESPLDLASSVTNAADEFLHQELDAYEEAELDRSIRQSLILSRNDPFNQDDVPGAFPGSAGSAVQGHGDAPLSPTVESTTALAGLVERILARLQVKVTNVVVRIRSDHRDHGATFELRISEIRYADESDPPAEINSGRTTVRALRISGLQIYLLPPSSTTTPSHERQKYASSTRSSSISSNFSSSDTGGNADLEMSQAVADLRQSMMVADLRQSMMASTVSSRSSMYASALSHVSEKEESAVAEEATTSRSSRSATPVGERKESGEQILSMGTDDIVLRFTTAHPPIDLPPSPNPQSPRVPPSIAVDLSLGTIAILLSPRHTASILCAFQSAANGTSNDEADVAPHAAASQQTANFQARLNVKAIFVTAIYDTDCPQNAIQTPVIQSYWTRPAQTHVPFGHLRLRLEEIGARYVSPANTTRPGSKVKISRSGSSSTPLRRGSIGASSLPSISLAVSEASIFEYLAAGSASPEDDLDDIPPGGAFPVLIFDANIAKQYGSTTAGPVTSKAPVSAPAPDFPEFDVLDWRNSGLQKKVPGNEKAWKVRSKLRGVLKGGLQEAAAGDDRPVVTVEKLLTPSSTAIVHLQPIHAFFDLSLVERLLPVLRFIAPAVRSPPSMRSTIVLPPRPNLQPARSSSYVIDDLDAQASSVSTIQPSSSPAIAIEVTCPMIRLDLRCPAPPNKRGTWGEDAHLRSGIVTIDVHGLKAAIGEPSAPTAQRRPSSYGERPHAPAPGAVEVEWQKMILFFCRAPEKRSKAFIIIGPLASDASEDDVSPLLPTLSVKSSTDRFTAVRTQTITTRIPSIQATITQPIIEGLQFFADDITHWLDGAFGDGSAPKPRDDLKMIGSRFFGSKGSSSESSSAVDEDEDEEEESNAAALLRVIISEVDISLRVPRAEPEAKERILALRASDVDVRVESNTAGKQETALNLVIMDADFVDRTESTSPIRILSRTTPLTLTISQSPIVQFRFSSLTDADTGNKETGIKLTCSSWTFFISKDLEWVGELKAFAKPPPGVFEDMEPSEITHIAIQLFDCGVHLTAPTAGGALLAVFGFLDVKTDLISDSDENSIEIGITRAHVLAIDDIKGAGALQAGYASSVDAWRGAGYASLVELVLLEAQVFRQLSEPSEQVLDILQMNLDVTACADSLASFGILAGDMAKLSPSKPSSHPAVPLKSPTQLDEFINVFASVDEAAFRQIPDITSGVDMIEDDLPTNLDYLDSTASRPAAIPTADRTGNGEGLRAWQTESDLRSDADVRLAAEVNGETIKILSSSPFEMDEEYWDNLPVLDAYSTSTKLGNTRVRIHDCNVGIYLHDGYDWPKTRKAIEDEIKAVRKRLEKIRQLLASGQKADESIAERPNSVLFNSIYIGLDQSRENLDAAALIAAIDEELEDLGAAETASQSSWQSFPAAAGAGSGGARTPKGGSKVRLRGKRLSRGKKPQIQISLSGVRGDLDIYDADDPTAARVSVTAKSLEILDHIKTSTWKKFLTEMKSDGRGNIRETDADMLRVELVNVRPSLPISSEEESRLKAKILPLRLHVDQDALDFLKRFFSFQSLSPASAPSPVPVEEARAPAKLPFFQYVEIFPIQLKLDYKPKRVDFAALRAGRTIELMNFFHFDGAEMTLRHVTLSGISGWERLGTTLQDIWTPDVKANQLADVIGGVSPIRSMVNVGSGVADLILLPIEQYRKDGRISKGVQRGTNSFVKSTALEMMKLGARLATGTQVILEKAEGVLGGSGKFNDPVVGEVAVPPSASSGTAGLGRGGEEEGWSSDEELSRTGGRGRGGKDQVSRYANQPANARQGVQEAYEAMAKNMTSAAQTILAVPMEVYERSGEDGPLRAVVRAVPIAVLKPMIGASEAVSKTLLGVRNSLDPEGRREQSDKYK